MIFIERESTQPVEPSLRQISTNNKKKEISFFFIDASLALLKICGESERNNNFFLLLTQLFIKVSIISRPRSTPSLLLVLSFSDELLSASALAYHYSDKDGKHMIPIIAVLPRLFPFIFKNSKHSLEIAAD